MILRVRSLFASPTANCLRTKSKKNRVVVVLAAGVFPHLRAFFSPFQNSTVRKVMKSDYSHRQKPVDYVTSASLSFFQGRKTASRAAGVILGAPVSVDYCKPSLWKCFLYGKKTPLQTLVTPKLRSNNFVPGFFIPASFLDIAWK